MTRSITTRLSGVAVALALCAAPALAQAPAPAPAQAPRVTAPSAAPPAPPAASAPKPSVAAPAPAKAADATNGSIPILDKLSQGMFSFNAKAAAFAQWAGEQTGFAGSAASAGLSRLFYNLLVEPVSAVTHFATGEFDKALVNIKRFAINTTYGIAGVYDPASEMGYPRAQADLGLALCKAGVPEGPYIVAPLMGPRTTRDALADYLASTTIVNAVFTPVVYGGLLGIDGPATRLVIDEATALTAARQFDPNTKAGADYAATRDAYLAQRRMRCAAQG